MLLYDIIRNSKFLICIYLYASVSYTEKETTLWYRSPELLLGDSNYGTYVDIWGVGCIMAEMWTRNPIMKGNSLINQLLKISEVCGSITPEVWPKVVNLQLFNNITLPRGQKRMVSI